MKFIQTLYIQDNQKVLSNSFGWAAPEFHLMSWCLSFLQLKKYYGDIELYANSPAVELLVGYLNLPMVFYFLKLLRGMIFSIYKHLGNMDCAFTCLSMAAISFCGINTRVKQKTAISRDDIPYYEQK